MLDRKLYMLREIMDQFIHNYLVFKIFCKLMHFIITRSKMQSRYMYPTYNNVGFAESEVLC